ncbi:MAG: hypothetical protein A2940_02275 [Candidatus Wildermuthbacteria bacterium RIFCSPLOWO2_01_FULL_48_29]|uniref:Inositol-phosphate phosphatase n=2 Tax=Candidatus Wildermuthiibacteriota TaxID=1817923 RepID=A0A1G2RMB5_9BACT|nr:MAG: hypothetical protein A2843_01990 [Candidatus Wildermuthbacteria bacterium RIFCSPHIGHO2_01_FULL_48_27b]OHA73509.1 MAG: hypothetical protein A2940_02275 [Candidatus Wildermuthbacteria bacterium RIFCSPLOWO2_01_FULL_48_29]
MLDYIELGTLIAQEAGAIMRKYFRAGKVETYWKADDAPVSQADTEINSLVLERLHRELPQFSLIGEEESLPQESEYAAVFDPLDGTLGFTHGVPTFVFSLAFCHKGNPFACVVYDPVLDRMFTAEKGKGALLNGERIRVNQKGLEASTVVGMAWAKTQGDLAEVQRCLIEKSVFVLQYASSVYTGCLVASGMFAASIYPVKYPWDAASVKLLVEEAGGRATSITGKNQRYDKAVKGILAANPVIFDALLSLVKEKAIITP